MPGQTMAARRPGWLRLAPRQFWALTWKNMLVRGRDWKLNLLHALQAVLLIFLVWAINEAINFSDATFTGLGAVHSASPVEVTSIPDCTENIFLKLGAPCLDFIYTPVGDPLTEAVIAGVRANNSPPIPAGRVLGLANVSEADSFLWDHPQLVLAAVHLSTGSNDDQAVSVIIQSNSSLEYFKGKFRNPMTYVQLPLQSAVQRELVRHAVQDATLPWSVAFQDFPHPSLTSTSTVGRVAPVFILASLMFNFVMLLTNLVTERESGVRQAMHAMGMLDSAFWLSWAVPEILFGLLHALLLCGASVAFRFDLAVHNNFALLFLLVFLTDVSLMAMCLLVSVFTRRASLAVPLSFAIYIVAWVFQLVVFFGFPYDPSYGQVWVVFFSIFPFTLLSKGIMDLAAATTGTNRGIPWSERSSYCWANTPPPEQQAALSYWQDNCIMPLEQIFLVLMLQALVFMLLAVYLDNVLPNDNGMRRAPWYYLQPSYWKPGRSCSTADASEALKFAPARLHGATKWDSDVLQEADVVQAHCRQYIQDSHLSHAAAAGAPTRLGGVAGETVLPSLRDVYSPRPAAPGVHSFDVDGGMYTEVADMRVKPAAEDLSWGSGLDAAGAGLPGVHMFGLRKVFDAPPSWGAFWAPLRRWCTPPWKQHPAPVRAAAAGAGRRGGGEAALGGAVSGRSGLPASTSVANLLPLAARDSMDAAAAAHEGDAGSSDSSGRGYQGAHVAAADSEVVTAASAPARALVAVDCNWLSIQPGQCFCLLGPNGAGKTTTIKLLTGALKPTGGDALVCGHSVRNAGGMDRIRSVMGVCPQFDVLWGELTGREHLLLFADIRGLPWERRHSEAEIALEQVKLVDAADRLSKTYSGGMRRRLSVAVALLGDPDVVILDEPTTGMDPISRRHVWDLICKAKAGRVIMLTTHSMEEADVLGDRIGIFAAGRLQCLGNSLHLKTKFGTGYRISVSVQRPEGGRGASHHEAAAAAERVRALVRRLLGVEAEDEHSRAWLHFLAPRNCEDRLPDLFGALSEPEMGVADVQVSLTPLEEVFLNVARRAEAEAGAKHGTHAAAAEATG